MTQRLEFLLADQEDMGSILALHIYFSLVGLLSAEKNENLQI